MKKIFILFFIGLCPLCFAQKDLSSEENLLPNVTTNIQKSNGKRTVDNNIAFANKEFSFISFSAIVKEKAVVISWKASMQNKNLIIYRSTQPFSNFSSLSKAIPIAAIQDRGSAYPDYPIAGIPFYYAIAEEHQLASGQISFVDGKNTILLPVEIIEMEDSSVELNKTEKRRPIPLPYLNPDKEYQKKVLYFSSQTEGIINALTAGKEDYRELSNTAIKRKIYIFPDDRRRPKGGETMELQRILRESCATRKWKLCERELKDFLKIRRTSRVTARSKFYLGEVLFFQGKYDEALLQFLIAGDMYPKQAKEWAQYSLVELSNIAKIKN